MTGSKAACALSGAGDVASDRSHVTQPTSQPDDNSGTRLDPRVPNTPPWTQSTRHTAAPTSQTAPAAGSATAPVCLTTPRGTPVRRPRARSERPAPQPQAHAVPANQIEIPHSNRIPKHAPDQLIIGASARARIAIRPRQSNPSKRQPRPFGSGLINRPFPSLISSSGPVSSFSFMLLHPAARLRRAP
jgi:hypothetical protein